MASEESNKLPSVRIHHVTLFVRDQERSLSFFRDQLGFELAAEYRLPDGERFLLVSPPDGSTSISLVTPHANSVYFDHIGRSRMTVLVTEDVFAQHRYWSERGVHFTREPRAEIWGGVTAFFEDPDGNQFALAGWDAITREIEQKRLAAAEKAMAERRAATELALAKDVQTRLFPQVSPRLETLDYTGRCVQARAVGGDYYDFLDLGKGQLGLVVGDVSGKGIAAALMMSNLQANLRSQAVNASQDPESALRLVSRLFYENSPGSAYATLFFAHYDENRQQLKYANCGHTAAIIVRVDGSVEFLSSTATVIGLFPQADCVIDQRSFAAGDTLAIFSDGVTEAMNPDNEEFGEERLIETLLASRSRSTSAMVDAVIERIREFSGVEQHDDITLVIAQAR